jgi:integrase
MASVAKRKWTYKGVEREAWVVRYQDPHGPRRNRTFEKKKDADKFRLQIENELEAGDHIAPGDSRTVRAATRLFLEEIDNKVAIGALRPTTAENYHSAFRQAILPAIGDKLILNVTSEDLELWYAHVVKTKRMEAVTARRRLWFVKALFEFAMRRRWARSNPAIPAMAAIGRPKEGKIETFALDEVRRVIVAANEKRYRGRDRSFEVTRLAVSLAAFCGLRWGEIFGLTVGHVDLPGRAIRIRHSLDRLGNLQEPKTKAGNREVPLPTHIAEMLTEFIAQHPITNDRGIIFASHNGAPMVATNFRSYSWLPLLKRAGVATAAGNPLRFHALRHFAVSWMIENGWPITDVSAIVGHANVAITLQVYAHVIKGRRQSAEAMQDLAERLLQTHPATQRLLLADATETQHGLNA